MLQYAFSIAKEIFYMLHPSTDVIANAYSFYIAEQSNTNLTKLLRAVSNLLREGADVQIPVSTAKNNL